MTANYATHVSTKKTSQQDVIPGREPDQAKNNAGGVSFVVDDLTRLDRFLMLGNEGGTYYVSEKKLTVQNAECVKRCLAQDIQGTIDRIVEISTSGRAPKNAPAVFAMALATTFNEASAAYVMSRLGEVCRTGTDLFQFVETLDQLRGWGRQICRGVSNWYLNKNPRSVAYQVVKYQQRNGWSQRDVMRLCHLNRHLFAPDRDSLKTIYHWVTKGWDEVGELPHPDAAILPIWAFEKAKRATSVQEIIHLINTYDLVRECIPTQFLNSPEVWEALLQKMPATAMLRNLAKMTACGLLSPFSQASTLVCKRLENRDFLLRGRIHPMTILMALRTYGQGKGVKGNLTWNPDRQILDALDAAFYQTFSLVEPTNLRWLLALDVSGSMGSSMIGGDSGLSAREASAALALVTANTERQYHIVGFTGSDRVNTQIRWFGARSPGIQELPLGAKTSLAAAVNTVNGLPFGPTDCALPMIYAQERKLPVDVFVVYTDSETWCGTIHPSQALKSYRQKMGIPAKLIVVGMTATEFSIADPEDAGSLDVVGFDTSVPQLMTEFAKG